MSNSESEVMPAWHRILALLIEMDTKKIDCQNIGTRIHSRSVISPRFREDLSMHEIHIVINKNFDSKRDY